MGYFELGGLKPGDLVRNSSDDVYVVTESFGSRVTVVRSVEIVHPHDWAKVVKEEPDDEDGD